MAKDSNGQALELLCSIIGANHLPILNAGLAYGPSPKFRPKNVNYCVQDGPASLWLFLNYVYYDDVWLLTKEYL